MSQWLMGSCRKAYHYTVGETQKHCQQTMRHNILFLLIYEKSLKEQNVIKVRV